MLKHTSHILPLLAHIIVVVFQAYHQKLWGWGSGSGNGQPTRASTLSVDVGGLVEKEGSLKVVKGSSDVGRGWEG